jgi:hypothetical protein
MAEAGTTADAACTLTTAGEGWAGTACGINNGPLRPQPCSVKVNSKKMPARTILEISMIANSKFDQDEIIPDNSLGREVMMDQIARQFCWS